jgi:hypothetical protein
MLTTCAAQWVVTSSQPVKVRSEPSLKGEVIGELPHGDIIDVCSRTDRYQKPRLVPLLIWTRRPICMASGFRAYANYNQMRHL